MLKSICSAIAVGLVASATFGGAAMASGDYYNGASALPAPTVDLFQTSSVETDRAVSAPDKAVMISSQSVDHGDYYQGASRPQ